MTDGFVEVDAFFAHDPELQSQILSKRRQACQAKRFFAGGTEELPLKGKLGAKVEICAKENPRIREAVLQAFDTSTFKVRDATVKRLTTGEQGDIPHADAEFPSELLCDP